jgi:deoxyribodipyrimidine photo-lyase
MICPATRSEALAQLASFVPKASLYARDRNAVRTGHPGVSRLSPAIRHRLLTEDEVATAVLAVHPFSRVEKFVQEIYWRRYWKSWLSLRPQVWADYQESLAAFQRDANEPEHARINQITAISSGNAIIDHFTRELIETGYLHNHARMWYAAWWIHAAGLPWQSGADFFLRHLLDGDPASNTLSWRWVAGLQTPGKTYLARRSNLEKYLDPSHLALAEDAWADFESPTPRIPKSSVSHAISQARCPESGLIPGLRTGLWIHSEDLSPETSPLGELAVEAAVVAAVSDFPPLKSGWLRQACQDAAARAAQHWRCEVEYDPAAAHSETLLAFATRHRLEQIVALRPDVGPLGDVLPDLMEKLAAIGVCLALVDRPRDLRLRPIATSGFFKFWETLQKKNLLPLPLPAQPDLF